jgi:hypothetical protein
MSRIYLQNRIIFDQLNKDKQYNSDGHLNDVGHFINENTVTRLASSMEEHGYKNKLLEKGNSKITLEEAAVGTTILFKNCILHYGGKLWYNPTTFYVPHYDLFCQSVKAAKVNIGDRLCLSIGDVVVKLIEGCQKYIK